MRTIFVYFIILVLPLTLVSQEYDFRKVNWGSSPSEVKSKESLTIYDKEDGVFSYKTTVVGYECLLMYYFTNNNLFSAIYFITEEHITANSYIDDYNSFKSNLTTKYGNPDDDGMEWLGDRPPDESFYGNSVITGELTMTATWENDGTIIVLNLSGGDYNAELTISYFSKQYGAEFFEKDYLDDL